MHDSLNGAPRGSHLNLTISMDSSTGCFMWSMLCTQEPSVSSSEQATEGREWQSMWLRWRGAGDAHNTAPQTWSTQGLRDNTGVEHRHQFTTHSKEGRILTYPAFATLMVCCSIASWMLVLSCSLMLLNSSMQQRPPSASTRAPASKFHSPESFTAVTVKPSGKKKGQ